MLVLGLLGCPFVDAQEFARVEDMDNDGLVAERFGGRDCDDSDRGIGDCDADRDGFRSLASGGEDCDDLKGGANPAAEERCNGIDDDCDGWIDDADSEVQNQAAFFIDNDGDAYGAGEAVFACERPAGHAAVDGDCNDSFPSIHPGVPERCDQVDWNCDGSEVGGAIREWFADEDGDGFGNPGVPLSTSCEAPDGGVSNPFDCDDTNPNAHPIGVVHPDATERCDGVDNDCDGLFDGDDPTLAADEAVWVFRDLDGDGFGAALSGELRCAADPGFVTNDLDCDDLDPIGRPSAPPVLGYVEICDGFDNDCNGLVDIEDPGIDPSSVFELHVDADADGFGDAFAPPRRTCVELAGWVGDASDCDDGAAMVHPGATEICGGGDEDCDGLVDSDDPTNGGRLWFPDGDGDGVGTEAGARALCELSGLPGFAPDPGDCNDQDAGITTEVLWFVDGDGDGHGDPGDLTPINNCFPQVGRAHSSDDCDDTNALINPNITEVCNGIDDNCTGGIDEGAPGSSQGYLDEDGDGYGQGVFGTFCAGVANNADDCDDTNAAVRPFATEVCDLVDNDCNGLTDDEDPSLVAVGWFPDEDFDGFGWSGPNGDLGVYTCARPPTYVDNDRDCNDENSAEYFSLYKIDPSAEEHSWFRQSIAAGLGNQGLCEDEPVVMLLVPGEHRFPNNLTLETGMIVRGLGEGVRLLMPQSAPAVQALLRFENLEVVPFVGSSVLIEAASGAQVEWIGVTLDGTDTVGPLVRHVGIGGVGVEFQSSTVANLDLEGGLIDLEGSNNTVLFDRSAFVGLESDGTLVELGGTVQITGTRFVDIEANGVVWTHSGTDLQVQRSSFTDLNLDGPAFCLECTNGTGASDEVPVDANLQGQALFTTNEFLRVSAPTLRPWLLWSHEGLQINSVGNTYQDDGTQVGVQPNEAAPAGRMVRLQGDDPGRVAWTSLRDRFIRVAGGFEVTAADLRFHESLIIGNNWPATSSASGQVSIVNTAFVGSQPRIDGAQLEVQSVVVASGAWPFADLTGQAVTQLYHYPGVTAPTGPQIFEMDPGTEAIVSWSAGLPIERRIPFPRSHGAFIYGNALTSLGGDLVGGASWSTDPNSDELTAAWLLFHGSTPACRLFLPELLLPEGDVDGDGLDNVAEWYAGTWPCVADTDGDGLMDGADPVPLDAD